MIEQLKSNMVDRISKYTALKKVATHEWAGPCPRCGGKDRFRVNDQRGWFCRTCQGEPGSSGHWGDYADFMQFLLGWSLKETLRSMGIDRRLKPEEVERLDAERRAAQQAQQAEEALKQATIHAELTSRPEWRNYAEQVKVNPEARAMWNKRGIDDRWAAYYAVGYNPGRSFGAADGPFTSASLTIPYFRPVWKDNKDFDHWHCIGLQHRLLAPNPPGGKYRPHLAGAGKHLFYTDMFDTSVWPGSLILVEGEIKAMVTWINLWAGEELLGSDYQVIGVPGKGWKEEWLAEFRKASRVYVILDPDAQQSAKRLCEAIGPTAKNVLLPDKIDDLFVMGVLDTFRFLELLDRA